jgi:hypothetical protein
MRQFNSADEIVAEYASGGLTPVQVLSYLLDVITDENVDAVARGLPEALREPFARYADAFRDFRMGDEVETVVGGTFEPGSQPTPPLVSPQHTRAFVVLAGWARRHGA